MEKFKRKKEEDEKVRLEEAYEEFRETFEEGVVKVSKTFIRGDIVNANQKVTPDKSNNGQPIIYKPSLVIQNKNLKTAPNLEMAKKIAEEAAKKIMKEASMPNKSEKDRTTKTASTKKTAEKSSRLTNLEAFKEELKQMQAMRDERKGLRQQLKEKLGVPEEELNRIAPALDTPYGGTVGAPSIAETDLSTTNLYVCNLPADTKIEDFFETFGSFGPLASAKILYPKENEERFRVTLSGFVAFMSRIDAERALCAMHGEILRSCELRVSWAKPVIIPPLPFYVPPPLRELAMPDPPSGLPFNAKPLTDDLRKFLQKYTDLPKLNTTIQAMDDDDVEMAKDYKKVRWWSTAQNQHPKTNPNQIMIS